MSEKTWLHWSKNFHLLCFANLSDPYHVWKDMAPLKHDYVKHDGKFTLRLTMSEKTWLHWSREHYPDVAWTKPNLPCLKRHGSIEAVVSDKPAILQQVAYHVWKDMAPLKLLRPKRFLNPLLTYHVWKDMAPLKPRKVIDLTELTDDLPCLKRHGSIEACNRSSNKRSSQCLPCLKRHGSIEA